MHRKQWLLPVLCLAATASVGTAAEENVVRRQGAPQSQGVLFVTPLLSEIEQAAYRAAIRAAKDESEKERIRSAHYELMKARAKERGYALPENRPAAAGVAGNAFGPQFDHRRGARGTAGQDAQRRECAVRRGHRASPQGTRSGDGFADKTGASGRGEV